MTVSRSRVELLFVYNADSGLFNSVADAAHKILAPSTYSRHRGHHRPSTSATVTRRR